jgi:hypothetical protein
MKISTPRLSRSNAAPTAAMIAAVIVTSALLAEPFGVGSDTPDEALPGSTQTVQQPEPTTKAVAATPTTQPVPVTTVTSSPAPSTTERVASLGPAPPPPITTPNGGSGTPMQPATAVDVIQTVPPIRDLLVVVDDRLEATDAAGALRLDATDRDATVRIIGPAADPPIEQVDFLSWADGSIDPERSLLSVTGPTVHVGLEIRTRVIVALGDGVPFADEVVLGSEQVGQIRVPVGVPTWVVSARAVRKNGELIPQTVTYRAAAVIADNQLVAVEPTILRPTPEALWTIEAK